jgi:hypothetical protein
MHGSLARGFQSNFDLNPYSFMDGLALNAMQMGTAFKP